MSIGLIKLKELLLPDFCDREILRYAGVRTSDDYDSKLLNDLKREISLSIKTTVVYREMPIEIHNDTVHLERVSVYSKALAKAMKRAEKTVFMAATLGIDTDRIIAKLSKISPARALLADAIASERIEALCDAFCLKLKEEVSPLGLSVGFRFSPGYGDLPLEFQKEIFSYLSPERYIGLTLNNSLMMSPSKSVSAIIAIERTKEE